MKRILSIRAKFLFIGLAPLGLMTILFLWTLSVLESSILHSMLVSDQDDFGHVWERLVKDEGRFLDFSGALIRQNHDLVTALKTNQTESIAQHSENIWNQVHERIDLLFFWNGLVPEQRLLHWIAPKSAPPDPSFTTSLLEQVATTRRTAVSVVRFPDGRLRLLQATAYFVAPGKPYNIAAQGVDLETLAERLKQLIGASEIRVINAPLSEPQSPHLGERDQAAWFQIPLRGVDGMAIGYLEIRKDMSAIVQGFTLAKQAALVVPGVLILVTGLLVLLFIHWLTRRLVALQEQLTAIAQGHIEMARWIFLVVLASPSIPTMPKRWIA